MCFYFWMEERGIRIDREERMGRCVCAGGSEGVGQPLSDLLAFAFCSESAWQSKTERKKVLRKADFSCQRDWPLSEPSWWLELVTYWSALNSSPLLNSAVYCKHHAGLRTVTHKLIKSLLVNAFQSLRQDTPGWIG